MSAPIIRNSRTSFDAVIGSGSAIIIDPNLVVTRQASDHALDGAHVFILSGYNVGEDVLSVDAIHIPVGITATWDSGGGVLRILKNDGIASGTFDAAIWQSILRNVKFSTTNALAGSKEINYVLGEHLALTVGGRARYYEFVQASRVSFTDARIQARSRTFFGLNGYLANIITEAENSFIKERIRQADGSIPRGWIGATDEVVNGVWKWVDGPDHDVQFWQGQSGSRATAVDGNYNSWAAGEPNNQGGSESYVHYKSDGFWNDLPNAGGTVGSSFEIQGYICEYGGYDTDPSLTITTTVVVDLQTASTVSSDNSQEIDAIETRVAVLESVGVAGPQGATGAQGAMGVAGVAGVAGANGVAGTQGVSGVAGSDGAQGLQGMAGSSGTDGAQGAQGVSGERGTAGVAGPQGERGMAGQSGIAGVVGAMGSRGEQGVAGERGMAGIDGVAGAVGLMGLMGSDGAQGIAGVQGDRGIQGIAGVAGIAGMSGPAGVAGMSGVAGPQGEQGVQGMDGDDFNGNARLLAAEAQILCMEGKITQLMSQLNAANLMSSNGVNFAVSCE